MSYPDRGPRYNRFRLFLKMAAGMRTVETNVAKTITKQLCRKHFVFKCNACHVYITTATNRYSGVNGQIK